MELFKNLKDKLNIKPHNKESPPFRIGEVISPVCFIFIQNNNEIFIHYKLYECDEILTLGYENDEITFYPYKSNSRFFSNDFSVDTHNLIILIMQNNLPSIAQDIIRHINFFKTNIHNSPFYINFKIENYEINIQNLNNKIILNALESTLKVDLYNLAKENTIDSNLRIFTYTFPYGIHNLELLMHKPNFNDEFYKYYNKSSLSNPTIEYQTKFNVENYELESSYYISSLFLAQNHNGGLELHCNLNVKKIWLNKFILPLATYINSEIKITIGDEIIIENLTNNIINLLEMGYKITANNKTLNTLHMNKINSILSANSSYKISYKNLIKTHTKIHLEKSKINAMFYALYYSQDSTKKLIGNSFYEFDLGDS